ncbi:MAG: ABC transporter ATP-binding protein [Firmicutes bacterium]|nr:ABC transporter ATP-binding protein [Bacillota bacterium]
MNNDVILKMDKVSYRYSDAPKDVYVFKDLSYEFKCGKMYAIRGKSGSGKTTLLSLISGLEKKYEGKIYFGDKDLSKVNLDKYRNTDIGIVFQSYNLLPHLTASENIILSMDINGIKGIKKKERALELLKSVGLGKKHEKRRVLKLSGGEQQRVAIARSMSYDPKILIADEPTGNLDGETEAEILSIFSDLAHNKNKCVIIVTHSEEVCAACDEVYALKSKKDLEEEMLQEKESKKKTKKSKNKK